jgi:hypothetical protein
MNIADLYFLPVIWEYFGPAIVNFLLPYLLYPAAVLWIFYGLYVLVMGVYRAKLSGRLSKFSLLLLAPWVVIGWLMDVLVNVTIATVIFVDLPREKLVTDRLQRYIAQPNPKALWRSTLAIWVCDHLLDVFDPNEDHC